MDASEGELGARPRPSARWTTFPVVIVLIMLALSALYALTFSRMLYVSLMEQVIAVDFHPPRYAPHVHYHNGVEWLLIVGPALLGWIGVIGCISYLIRHWRAR